MKNDSERKTEDFLKTFSLKPAPLGLKEKILDQIPQRKKISPVMTPFLWKGFMGCMLLLMGVLVVDAAVSKTQSKRIQTFFKKSTAPHVMRGEDWILLEEIIGEPLDSLQNNAGNVVFTLEEKGEKIKHYPKEIDVLEEEFGYYENTKNFH